MTKDKRIFHITMNLASLGAYVVAKYPNIVMEWGEEMDRNFSNKEVDSK